MFHPQLSRNTCFQHRIGAVLTVMMSLYIAHSSDTAKRWKNRSKIIADRIKHGREKSIIDRYNGIDLDFFYPTTNYLQVIGTSLISLMISKWMSSCMVIQWKGPFTQYDIHFKSLCPADEIDCQCTWNVIYSWIRSQNYLTFRVSHRVNWQPYGKDWMRWPLKWTSQRYLLLLKISWQKW